MGTLYYFAREDTHEVFALNKSYGYERAYQSDEEGDVPQWADDFKTPTPLATYAADPIAFAERYIRTPRDGWALRIAERLFRWAGDAPIRFISEHALDDLEDAWGIEDYDGRRAHVTGSAHDSDYENDGVTYKAGSAW